MAGTARQEADRKALESVGRGLEYLAAVVLVVAFVGGYLAKFPLAEAILVALVLGLAVFVLFLWYSRSHLIDTAVASGRAEEASLRKNAELESELTRLRPLEPRLKENEVRLAQLSAGHEALRKSADQLKQENDSLRQRATSAESAFGEADARARQLETNLRAEKNSTARAPYMPEIDVEIRVVGFGILSSKTVQAVVTNVGRGNATGVQTSVRSGDANQHVVPTPRDFSTTLRPGERRTVSLGTLEDFQGRTWVEAIVEYGSQFGPRPPVGVRETLL
jgi:hypothetical protein